MEEKMKKSLGILFAAVVLIAGTLSFTPVFGQPGPGFRGPGGPGDGFAGPHFLGRLADKLGLSDAQREQAKAILEAERNANEPTIEELQANREALRAASKFGAFAQNEAEITALAQRQGELHALLIVSRERVKSQLYDILTPEQQQQLQDLAEMMDGFDGPPHHRRRGN